MSRRERTRRPEFRLARPSDLAALLPLVRAYYRHDRIRFEKRAVRAALATLLRRRSLGRIWILWDGASAVGYVALTFNYDLEFNGMEGFVTDLFFRSEYRRRGFGKQAIALVRAYCRSAGIGTIELQVEERNRDAQAFYRRLGFERLTRIVMAQRV